MMCRKLFLMALLLLLQFPGRSQTPPRPALVIQGGHNATINSVAVSADGNTLLTASDDQTLKLWDAVTGRVIRNFMGHQGNVYGARFSPDGKTLVSVASDGTVKIWDLATGQALRSLLTGETVSNGALAVSPDGKFIASAQETLRLWDAASGQLRHTVKQTMLALAFSPDSQLLAAVVFADKRLVQLRNPNTGVVVRELPADAGYSQQSLSFSPDGRLLAVVTSHDTVDLWDVAQGNVVRSFGDESYLDIPAVAFSPDGRLLLISNAPGRATIRRSLDLCDVNTGALVRRIDTSQSEMQANALSFHPNGKTFLTAGFTYLSQWDVAGGTLLHTFERPQEKKVTLALSPQSQLVMLGIEGNGAQLWDANFALQTELAGGDGFSYAIFSPDGQMVVADNTSNPYPAFWKTDSGQKLGRLDNYRSALFSPDSQALAYHQDNTINIHDSQALKLARMLRGHTGEVIQNSFTPDGKLLVSISADKTARVWNWRTGATVQTLAGLADTPTSLALTNKTAGIIDNSGNVTVWDLATGKKQAGWAAGKGYAWVLALSPDGKTLATATWEAVTQVWDAATGQPLRVLAGGPCRDFVVALMFSPDGASLLQTEKYEERRQRVRLWQVAGGHLTREWEGGESGPALHDAVFNRNGQQVFITSDMQSGVTNFRNVGTRIYATTTGELLADVVGFTDGSWAVVTPDGLFDGQPAAWEKLNWRFGATAVAPVEVFFNEFYYPGLLSEVLSGQPPAPPRSLSRIDRRQPQVELLAVGAPTTRTVKLRLRVAEPTATSAQPTGGGAQDVRLLRNGALIKAFRGDVLKKQKSVILETEVTLSAGENRFNAYAFNRDNVKSQDATLTINGAESLRRPATLHILAMGVNQYANRAFNLKYAVADAQDFTTELQRQQEKLNQFARTEVTLLRDSQATKQNFLAALQTLAQKAQPEDTVLLFFAGHGLADEPRFYLIPHDLGYDGPRSAAALTPKLRDIYAHAISDEELERSLDPLDAGRILLVIDACNSGQLLESAEKRRGPMNSKGLAQLAYEKGMYILTAAQSYQAALEAAQLGHGLLTYALVEEGLRQGRADQGQTDGAIVAREWFDFASRRVPQMQLEKMKQARQLGLGLAVVEGEEKTPVVENRSLQRPRGFYRRENEPQPFIMGRVGGTGP